MIRSVDQSKCIGCGTCQRICPLDVFRLEVNQPIASPCMAACPVGNNIRKINNLLELGRVNDAATLMFENNPLASITGRVCPRFCETDCTRNQVDAAVNISAIEQYLGDYMLQKDVERVSRRHVAPIAVIGSGPAGLSCAFSLAADGFNVTVYEAMKEPGGMLRYGIPEYRLPNNIISSVMDRLTKMGVDIRCGQSLNETFTIDDLLAQDYGAVFLALGAGKPKEIQIEGIESDSVFYGIDFLKAVKTKQFPKIGPDVVVVGGGDVAMDAAQSSLRLGAHSVTIVALEDDSCLPAFPHNVETAKAGGVNIICSYGIEKIVCNGDNVKGLTLKRCVSVFDDEGAFSPTFEEADTKEINANTVILAIGQETQYPELPRDMLGTDGLIKASSHSYQTAMPKVFAAGDVVTGPSSVAEAAYGGKRAAQAINLFLRGMELEGLPPRDIPITDRLPEDKQLRKAMRNEKKPVAQIGNPGFSELYKGLDMVETLAEADRCLVCGAKSIAAYLDDCMTCFSCELNCPVEAIFVHPYKEILPRSLRSI
jgi:NADPH-dependent glutamate synthase beta subunit-like oxidoreductase/NAD-dependent dihydropyrimidine dehydrogenase PreA subunit